MNHSAANSSAIGPNVCHACNEPYRTLDAAYKKITESAPQEFSICADVSASVSTVSLLYIQNCSLKLSTVEPLF